MSSNYFDMCTKAHRTVLMRETLMAEVKPSILLTMWAYEIGERGTWVEDKFNLDRHTKKVERV